MHTHRRNFFCTLAVLFFALPAFTYASSSPTLTTYTISNDTIYPTAAVESNLATTTAIDTDFSEQVKVSIKIMSASGALIKSLYSSSSVTNPAPKIWDGKNSANTVVGNGVYTVLISATSTADNSLTMTDSSKTITIASPSSSDSSSSDSTSTDASSETTSTTENITTSSSDSGPPQYIPIPTLRVVTSGDRTVSSGADTAFTAVVYDGKSNKRNDAIISWSFGDGMQKTGASVFHKYYEPGEYVTIVHASTSDGGDAVVEAVITVKNASIKIISISARGITLANNDTRTLDLSLWRLSSGGQEFKIPENTKILAGHTILFSSKVIELPTASSASLLFPSGEVADAYPVLSFKAPVLSEDKKLSVSNSSINTVQEVEPIISKKKITQIDEKNAVSAPAPEMELAGAGAELPTVSSSTITTKATTVHNSNSRSIWALSLLGIMAVAGGAFIFL